MRKFPKRYEYFASSIAFISNDEEPSCFQEEMEVSESANWKVAMKEKIYVLEKNKTWDLVEIPKDKKFVGCKWVYKLRKVLKTRLQNIKKKL